MKLALPVLLQLSLGLGSGPYERTHVQSNDDARLWPCLWWGDSAVVFNQSDLGNPVTGDAAFTAVSNALASWQAAMNNCGSLALAEGPHVSARAIGYDPSSASNPNLVVFRTRSCSAVVPDSDPCRSSGDCGNQYDCWFYGSYVIALTTTHYKIESGQILHADVEMNSTADPLSREAYYFTAVDSPRCDPLDRSSWSQSCVAWDIQNSMTHEFGHSLGLDHTSYSTSIMTPTSVAGETWKRRIDSGSSQFVCDVYPAGLPPRDCHKLLRLDASTQCSSDSQQDPGTCHHTFFSCSAGGGSRSITAALLGVSLWLLTARPPRRHAERSRPGSPLR